MRVGVFKMRCDVTLTNRIKRAKGQLQGILQMMDNESACEDIVMQLQAVKSSIEKSIGILTTSNLLQKIEDEHQIDLENMNDAVKLIIRNM